MTRPHDEADQQRGDERRWAVVRIVLGTAQIMVATFATVVLLTHGVDEIAVGAGVVAVLLIVTSRILFWKERLTR